MTRCNTKVLDKGETQTLSLQLFIHSFSLFPHAELINSGWRLPIKPNTRDASPRSDFTADLPPMRNTNLLLIDFPMFPFQHLQCAADETRKTQILDIRCYWKSQDINSLYSTRLSRRQAVIHSKLNFINKREGCKDKSAWNSQPIFPVVNKDYWSVFLQANTTSKILI